MDTETVKQLCKEYPKVLQSKSVGRKSKLVERDCWYRNELPLCYSKGYLTKDELRRVMEWKLTVK